MQITQLKLCIEYTKHLNSIYYNYGLFCCHVERTLLDKAYPCDNMVQFAPSCIGDVHST